MKKIEFDVKKISRIPKDKFDAIDLMTETQIDLVNALFIMKSILENKGDEFKEVHEKKIIEFVNKFI